MAEQPEMYYWAETGTDVKNGKYSVVIDHDARTSGGIFFNGKITAVGLKNWLPFIKAMYSGLKAAGIEPKLVNGSPEGIGRKLTPEEEQQVLQALRGE